MALSRSVVVVVVFAALGTGCATFTTVRSAEVTRGSTITVQGSGSTSVGDEAGWFYAYDCASACDRPVGGVDLTFAHGLGENQSRTTVGFGLSGVYPFFEVYRQIGRSQRTPFGIGARLGIPLTSWSEHRLYGRMDFVSRDGRTRLLWNPGLVMTTGNSPNGENHGTFLGLANGFGLELGQGNVVLTPSVSIVTSRASHTSYGQVHGPGYSTFATAAMSVTFRRGR